MQQSNWKWCDKCSGLTYAGSATPGPCAFGGSHETTYSGDYTLNVDPPEPFGQMNWRWCNKCQALAWAGGSSPGLCAAGGTHDHTGSGNYGVSTSFSEVGMQGGWTWCCKCMALWYGDVAATWARCPAAGVLGGHDGKGSGYYFLNITPGTTEVVPAEAVAGR